MPGFAFTARAITVSAPKSWRTSASIIRLNGSRAAGKSGCAYCTAARVSLTMDANCNATRCACGSRSRMRTPSTHAARLAETNSAISKTVRRNSPPQMISRNLIRDKYISQSPHRLNKAGIARILFNQFAQPRDLHIQAAVEHFIFASAREFRQFVARQRLTRRSRKDFKQCKFAGCQRHFLTVFSQGARCKVERKIAELEDFSLFRRRARQLWRRAAAQHRMNARNQLARIERLGQII